MATVARGEQTKADILRTAGGLFALHGYFQTSTNDILEAVSISKGAFYHHFRSKEDLACAVLEQVGGEYEQMVAEPVLGMTDPGQRPEAMLDKIVELNELGHWSNCLLLARFAQEMMLQEGRLSEKVAGIVSWMIGLWEELFADAQGAGTVSASFEPRRLAELVTAVLLGVVGFGELEGKPFDLARIAEQIKLMIRG